MQRHPAFHPLISEHHRALVTAHRILKALAKGDPGELSALATQAAADLRGRWGRHFSCEERLFAALPDTVQARAAALIARILDEHVAMRSLAARLEAGDVPTLAVFAARLRDHTRLEERELIPLLEQLSDADTLARLGTLWRECDPT